MSTIEHPELFVGLQETFSKVITNGEAALFAGLIGDNTPQVVDTLAASAKPAQKLYVLQFLVTGIISGILHTRIPGTTSQCVTVHFEFLAPIHTDEQIFTTIEVIGYDAQKRLATFKADCYDQNKNQVITGQAVMLISA